jgi:sugar (pentulose or hexulose) kinase
MTSHSSHNRSEAYVVFDIGKTQKKLIVFDHSYAVIRERSIELATVVDEDGFECDDVGAIAEWVRREWASLYADPAFNIAGLNFTSYGATVVNIDEEGMVVTPLYNYLKPVAPDILEAFYEKFGSREKFAVQTCSPPLGMLNAGFQLYWLKYHRPQLFRHIRFSVFLPQYLSYLFCGVKNTDLTSLGCHTGLWSFQHADLHPWVYDEWLQNLIPTVTKDHIAGYLENGNGRVAVGVGLHDSSAALLPYLYLSEEPFILLSTGTWAITLNPFNRSPLTPEELLNDVLVYMLPNGDPVKAARFLLGPEHDRQCESIAAKFGKAQDFFGGMKWEEEQYERICAQGENEMLGEDNEVAAYYRLVFTLTESLLRSFTRVDDPGIKTVFVDGGFARNAIFLQMLKKKLPGKKLFTSKVPQATALGALIHLRKPRELDLPGVELVSL